MIMISALDSIETFAGSKILVLVATNAIVAITSIKFLFETFTGGNLIDF